MLKTSSRIWTPFTLRSHHLCKPQDLEPIYPQDSLCVYRSPRIWTTFTLRSFKVPEFRPHLPSGVVIWASPRIWTPFTLRILYVHVYIQVLGLEPHLPSGLLSSRIWTPFTLRSRHLCKPQDLDPIYPQESLFA